MAKDLNRTIRVRGAIKVVVGILMLALVDLVVYIGAIVRFIGGLSLISGIATKIASFYSQDKEKKAFWQERTRKLMYFGGISFVGGFAAAIPFLAGFAVIFEGVYNIVKMQNSRGIRPGLKKAGKFMENLVSGAFRAKKSADSDAIDVKIIEEKKPAAKKTSAKKSEAKKTVAKKPAAKKTTASSEKKKAPTSSKK